MRDEALVLRASKSIQRVEITRSFSFKVNRGNYESSDYFCSQKGECDIEDAEDLSEALYQFCKSQVMKAVRQDTEPARRKTA